MPRLILIPDDLEERLRETDGFTPADDSVIAEVVALIDAPRDTQFHRADNFDAYYLAWTNPANRASTDSVGW